MLWWSSSALRSSRASSRHAHCRFHGGWGKNTLQTFLSDRKEKNSCSHLLFRILVVSFWQIHSESSPNLVSCPAVFDGDGAHRTRHHTVCALLRSHRFLHREGAEAWIWRFWSVIYRYSIHLWDLNHEGTWENKSSYIYYTDFIMELVILSLDLMHHIHMLVREILVNGQTGLHTRSVWLAPSDWWTWPDRTQSPESNIMFTDQLFTVMTLIGMWFVAIRLKRPRVNTSGTCDFFLLSRLCFIFRWVFE